MIFNLYAIKDELSEYAAPIPLKDEPNAKRYFRETVKSTPMMNNNPEDFSIWHVGWYNTEDGTVNGQTPKLVERGQMKPNEHKE